MAARMALTMAPVTATSANWKVMARAGRTTRAPILISFNRRLVRWDGCRPPQTVSNCAKVVVFNATQTEGTAR
jgi:hypothetical protein